MVIWQVFKHHKQSDKAHGPLVFFFFSGKLKIVTQHLYYDDNLYFELLEPETISYTYRIRSAKDFGPHMVCVPINNVLNPVP